MKRRRKKLPQSNTTISSLIQISLPLIWWRKAIWAGENANARQTLSLVYQFRTLLIVFIQLHLPMNTFLLAIKRQTNDAKSCAMRRKGRWWIRKAILWPA